MTEQHESNFQKQPVTLGAFIKSPLGVVLLTLVAAILGVIIADWEPPSWFYWVVASSCIGVFVYWRLHLQARAIKMLEKEVSDFEKSRIPLLLEDITKLKTENDETQNTLKDEIENLTKELKKQKALRDKPEHIHKRFEEIISKAHLAYVAIDYKPFFWKDTTTYPEQHKGIGYELMNKIFEPFNVDLKNETPANGHSWYSIFEDFAKGRRADLDLILTPMFETRSRLYEYNVIYSDALFYSEIGIYVRTTSVTRELNLNYNDATDLLREKVEKEKWKLEFLPGEISEILGKKLSGERADLKRRGAANYGYAEFYNKLNDVALDDRTKGDFIFMEVFKAEAIIRDKNLNLVNILKNNQLVYPVGFVIHKEETVLRNFINFRIAELRKSGALARIIKYAAHKIDVTDQKVIDRIFLQNYDFKLIDQNFRQRNIMFPDHIKEEYDLLDKVYNNFISFQKDIGKFILDNTKRSEQPLKILEIGFGTGITTNIILELDRKMDLTLVDNDPVMKDLAQENINANGHDIKYVVSDIIDYLEKCPSNSFDVVVSGYTIHNFDTEMRSNLFSLIFQVLKQPGLLVNADKYAQDDDNVRIKSLQYRVNKFIDYMLRENKFDVLKDWVQHYIDDQAPDKVMKELESKSELHSIGFQEVNIERTVEEIEMMAILVAKRL